jgi:hypothetical protein
MYVGTKGGVPRPRPKIGGMLHTMEGRMTPLFFAKRFGGLIISTIFVETN